MITVTNSWTFMEMMLPSLLSDLKSRVQRLTSSGKLMCHQKLSLIEYPLEPSRQLLPIKDAVGVRGMTWVISVFHKIPEFGCSLSLKNSISWHIDLLMMYLNLA